MGVENRGCNFYISNKITRLNSFKVRRNVLLRKGSAFSLRLESAERLVSSDSCYLSGDKIYAGY